MEQDEVTARTVKSPRAQPGPYPGHYGDRCAAEGGAWWALWELTSGRVLPGRYLSFAEAEAARGGKTEWMACLQYAWDGAD